MFDFCKLDVYDVEYCRGLFTIQQLERKNFKVTARGSAFESAAIMEYLLDRSEIQKEVFDDFMDKLEQISKIMFRLIQHLDNEK